MNSFGKGLERLKSMYTFLDKFKCTRCGECCRHLEKIDGLKHLQINGGCKYLKDNECLVYEIRPLLCNRYRLYEALKNEMSEEKFYTLLEEYCTLFKTMKEEK